MLTIRLQRIGKKAQPSYRLIISEKAKATNSSVLEYLGHYHPAEKNKKIELNKERIEYWLSKGAQTSNTVHNLFVQNNIIKDKKVKTFYIPTKIKNKKIEEAKKAEENKKKQQEEAKKTEENVKKEETVEASTEESKETK